MDDKATTSGNKLMLERRTFETFGNLNIIVWFCQSSESYVCYYKTLNIFFLESEIPNVVQTVAENLGLTVNTKI